MSEAENIAEADRLMTICNSCRYCEGLCAVFPAMELRRSFETGDLDYLASLCHNCGACYSDCQFSPPHEFNVNIPRVMAEVRADSYRRHVWPAALKPMFDRTGMAVVFAAAISVAGFVAGFVAFHDPAMLFSTQTGSGAFYRLMPHDAMAWLFILLSVYVVVALGMSIGNYWRAIGGANVLAKPRATVQALRDAFTLRYLGGGGQGCAEDAETLSNRRKIFHHLTFYGFVLCFASTSVATVYHYVLGLEAPYPWYDLPVLLGLVGGVGLAVGPVGLVLAKYQRDQLLNDPASMGMDNAFLAMLFCTGLTGLALTAFRETPVMGILLAVHLGVVFALFVAMPYSKFVHGFYRIAALVHFHMEQAEELDAAAAGADA
ncbi:MAG TPA: tricarballylate utilization 4Fe-4S protein TcuB [Reyranella sp.]|jgi:citrate/tricarballylate utilization protein